MARYASTSGIVLTKKELLKGDKLIILFTPDLGKISVIAKGVSSITSRRLPHLESGNYIKCSFYHKESSYYLQETELIYGYSKIKSSPERVQYMYPILFILYQLLPNDQPEEELFLLTQHFFKELNNIDTISKELINNYLIKLLLKGGYISEEKVQEEYFNPHIFMEELIGKRIQMPIF